MKYPTNDKEFLFEIILISATAEAISENMDILGQA